MTKIKSSFELAMERFGGPENNLSNQQKEELAEIDRKLRADIAHVEIMHEQDVILARSVGDPEKIRAIQESKTEAIQRLNSEAEDARERIRNP